jgi:hypothetical protein
VTQDRDAIEQEIDQLLAEAGMAPLDSPPKVDDTELLAGIFEDEKPHLFASDLPVEAGDDDGSATHPSDGWSAPSAETQVVPRTAVAASADNDARIDAALAEERTRRDPIEAFNYLKGVRGFTAPYVHATLGRVVAVAYFEVTKDATKQRFNCQIDNVPFFDAVALDELSRKTAAGRFVVKLLPWKEGTTIRRWGNDGSGRDDPKCGMTFIITGDALVRR